MVGKTIWNSNCHFNIKLIFFECVLISIFSSNSRFIFIFFGRNWITLMSQVTHMWFWKCDIKNVKAKKSTDPIYCMHISFWTNTTMGPKIQTKNILLVRQKNKWHSFVTCSSVNCYFDFTKGTIHLRRRQFLGGEGCLHCQHLPIL